MSLTQIVHATLTEQIRITEALVARVPGDRLAWRPELAKDARPAFRLDELLGHLLECLAGFCAVLQAPHRVELAHFEELRRRRRNHRAEPDETLTELAVYSAAIDEGFSLLTDRDLSRTLPTLFEPEGSAVLTLLLENFEHLLHHKYQLFFYLRMLGVAVDTSDLYGIDRG